MKQLIFLTALLVSACATTGVPEGIREIPASTLTPAEARSAGASVGTQVRWGGTIAKIENQKTATWIEVVERSLDRNGKPRDGEGTTGRFLAYVDGFLEPTVYAPGRKITVAGTVEQNRSGSIGEFPYVFPVIKVREHYLWPREPERTYSPYPPSPLWYDPWYPWGWGGYYPWHPYYPWW